MNNGTNVPFSQMSVFTITGLVGTGAAQSYTLDFTWTMSATSTAPSSGVGNISDEAAVRLGQTATTTLAGTTAGNYPGGVADVPSRVSCNGSTDLSTCDGHTVRVSVTEVPPSLSLLGFGLAAGGGGLWWRRWRRR